MRARRRNPSTATIVSAVVAGIVGMAVGYGLSTTAKADVTMDLPQWLYWVEDVPGVWTGNRYRPVIQSPSGERFELPGQVTKYSAEKAAQDAIEERGGQPVPGKPL